MELKSLVETIQSLPADADSEDIIEKIIFLKNLEQAEDQADKGLLLSEQEIRSRLGKWLS